ncbi:MAG: hypothetical protein EG826_04100 [Deltaproteobacteria bacterium]|nr:hypothetical protein [Deltaproteobacteria bacterium]
MDVLSLLKYSEFLRHKYLETLSTLPWEEVVKDRGASFPSLRDIYLHMVFVADAYINYALQGMRNYPNVNYGEYDSIEKMAKYRDAVEAGARVNLDKMTPEVLAKNETILLDFFQEETHHRGELIALLWQMDVEPPHTGFLKYQRAAEKK